jgi:hypothetical protein
LNKLADELKLRNFRGVISKDELRNLTPLAQECGILGSQNSDEYKNIHWTCWYIDENSPFFYKKVYFDSYGVFPPTNEILDYLKPKNDTLLNDKQIQSYNESTCGEYCLYVLYKLNKGENFIDVLTPFGDYLNDAARRKTAVFEEED